MYKIKYAICTIHEVFRRQAPDSLLVKVGRAPPAYRFNKPSSITRTS